VVWSASSRWQPGARARGIELSCQDQERPVCAWSSSADVERALDCLVENAINYSPSGSSVELAAAAGRIEVRDRGPGLSDDERDAVFERFHRGRAARIGPAGSGLGLAIARELARGWGGNVEIEDREGGGSVAILSLAVGPADTVPIRLRALNPPASTFRP
jgi:signal transduction histidine kinase